MNQTFVLKSAVTTEIPFISCFHQITLQFYLCQFSDKYNIYLLKCLTANQVKHAKGNVMFHKNIDFYTSQFSIRIFIYVYIIFTASHDISKFKHIITVFMSQSVTGNRQMCGTNKRKCVWGGYKLCIFFL